MKRWLATPYPLLPNPFMTELNASQLLDLINDNQDWLTDSEDPAAMFAALVNVTEKQLNAQPVAA